MASKRIDELDARTVADTDLLPVTPSGGPSGKATVAAIVAEGLSQPNSASAGAGASITIKAADGVTSGAGGSIVLQPGAQATTGGNGTVRIMQSDASQYGTLSATTVSANLFTINFIGGASGTFGELAFFARSSSVNTQTFKVNYQNYIELHVNAVVRWADSSSTQLLRESLRLGRVANTGGSLRSESAGILGIWNESAFTAGGSFSFKSNTPAAIVANQNDYVLNHSAFQRLNCTTASDITGIAPPTGGAHVDGRMIRLVSVGTATVTLKNNDAASTAANRMYMHGGNHTALTVNEWADLVYDSADNGSGAAGWRVVKYA
jgi:hypothetical protein